jgi:hypothetical protein
MSAWGPGYFDNDDALDLIGELQESGGSTALEDALNAIPLDDSEYVEAPECSMAIAAAEIVAALSKHPSADLPDEIKKWIKGKLVPNERLRKLAHDAIDRIGRSSELRELWAESPDGKAWSASLRDLQRRLADAKAA